MDAFKPALISIANEIENRKRVIDTWERLGRELPTSVEMSLLDDRIKQLNHVLKQCKPSECAAYQSLLNHAQLKMSAANYMHTDTHKAKIVRLKKEILQLRNSYYKIAKLQTDSISR